MFALQRATGRMVGPAMTQATETIANKLKNNPLQSQSPASGPSANQKRGVWTQDVAFGLNVPGFYKAAAKLEAATEAAPLKDFLDKGQPKKLAAEKPWVTFGFHSGQYMSQPVEGFEHGKLTPADGEPPYTDTVRDVMKVSRENNGVIHAMFQGWDAKTHFQELAQMGADRGQNYNEVVTDLPLNTMLTDTSDGNPFAAAMMGLDLDESPKLHDSETWGLTQKPSITTIEFAYMFEGEGRAEEKHMSMFDNSGQPLSRNKFLALYDAAAKEVHKSTDGTLSADALEKIDALQTYVKDGEPVQTREMIGKKMIDSSPYLKAWAEHGTDAYKRNFNQLMTKLDTYFQGLKPGEAVGFTMEVPKAYDTITHMMSGMVVMRSSGEPDLHLAHHESVVVDPSNPKGPDWKAGEMRNVQGIPTDNHDTTDLFPYEKPLERTPLLNSLRNGGTPNVTMFKVGNPMPIIDKIAVEARNTKEGVRMNYSPRTTDSGDANTCIAQTARLLTTPGADLQTLDGEKIDTSEITTTDVPEIVRDMHRLGLTTVSPVTLADFVVSPFGKAGAVVFENKGGSSVQDEALKGMAGAAQFGALGATWGAGNVPAVKEGMTTPIDAKPLSERQPHHIGVFDEDFKLDVGALDQTKP